jgi:hypothetical protein
MFRSQDEYMIVLMLITLDNELHTAEMPKVSSHVNKLVFFT